MKSSLSARASSARYVQVAIGASGLEYDAMMGSGDTAMLQAHLRS